MNAQQHAPVVTIDRVSVVLGRTTLLSDVTCRLDAPGVVALAGPNGAGKSTLLRAIAGLTAHQGRIAVEGLDLATLDARARARTIAFMPQERTVHWNLPARALVDLGRMPHRSLNAGPSASDRAAVDAALARMDAAHLADRPVLSLSGGERARVLMARALAQDARVLIADEPGAGLDPAHAFALFEALQAVAETGTRVIVAMHDLSLMTRFAVTVVLLDRGRLIAVGRPGDVFDDARLAAVYGVTAVRTDAGLVVTGLAARGTAAQP